MTRLDKPLKREVKIKNKPHVLTIDPNGLRLTQKGRRKGIELKWTDLASGDAASTPRGAWGYPGQDQPRVVSTLGVSSGVRWMSPRRSSA